jgi:hypothetical protein
MKTVRYRNWLLGGGMLLLLTTSFFSARAQWRGRMADHDENPPTPNPDEETEYYFARLAYRNGPYARRWRNAWMTDSPAADRYFLQGVRRLTNIHARTREQYIKPLDDELFNYPWIYAVEVGQWTLDENEAARLREYLLRGGFLVVDDFHGTMEWQGFFESIERVFPGRPIVEIELDDPVFHVLYDLNQKTQIPGIQFLRSGRTSEKDGYTPHWRGIYDDKGRLMVVINFNMDLGDAWEWADYPEYPEQWTALAYRFGINYIIYSMTH